MESNKMMNTDLITRFLENKCTEEEKREIYEQLGSPDNEKIFKEKAISYLGEFYGDQDESLKVDFEKIYVDLLSVIKQKQSRVSEMRMIQRRVKLRRLIYGSISIAAIFCIAFFLGSSFNRAPAAGISEQPPAASKQYTEIKAPLGARSEVKLIDGTRVMLNAGSSIRYRNDYNSLNRDLILEGEAYFTVAKNTELPLVVNAGNINIKATGTEFNVKAYLDEGIVETTLINGTVEISQKGNTDKKDIIVLEPSQKAIYALLTDKITFEKIKELTSQSVKPAIVLKDKFLVAPKTDVDQVTAWTKNKLIIKSENLESLCTKLQRKYNVSFVFLNEEIKKQRFSGTLLDETLEQVLDVIKLTAPIDYLLDGKTVTMFLNKSQKDKYSKTTVKDKI
jgi:transmembrane sensor